MAGQLPTFRRQPLAIASPDGTRSTVNWSRDLIVKCARLSGEDELPIGVVSRQYCLVQHTTVLARAAGALESAGISPSQVKCDLSLTTHGERMALRIRLPSPYDFDPGDGHPMALRLECFNSVEGSCRFMAVLSWFRLVCRNGLVIGISRTVVRRHDRHLEVEEIGQILTEGLRSAEAERAVYASWMRRQVKRDLKIGVCGEHGGDPASIHFFHRVGLDYVSCSPYRVPIARLAAAQAQLEKPVGD